MRKLCALIISLIPVPFCVGLGGSAALSRAGIKVTHYIKFGHDTRAVRFIILPRNFSPYKAWRADQGLSCASAIGAIQDLPSSQEAVMKR